MKITRYNLSVDSVPLMEAFLDHPEGSAVVTEMGRLRPYVAIVNLDKPGAQAPSVAGNSSRGRVYSVHAVGGRSAA
jgi:hypothetical protein